MPKVKDKEEQEIAKKTAEHERQPSAAPDAIIEESDEDLTDDDDPNGERLLDEIIKHELEGREDKVFCFARHPFCVSEKYIELMNYFGNSGGFD